MLKHLLSESQHLIVKMPNTCSQIYLDESTEMYYVKYNELIYLYSDIAIGDVQMYSLIISINIVILIKSAE